MTGKTMLRHMFDPSRAYASPTSKWRGGVHYATPDGQSLLCGHGSTWREVDGERYPMWHETKRAITCQICTKQVRALTRMQLESLDAEQCETLLDHIAALRNGNGHDTKEEAHDGVG